MLAELLAELAEVVLASLNSWVAVVDHILRQPSIATWELVLESLITSNPLQIIVFASSALRFFSCFWVCSCGSSSKTQHRPLPPDAPAAWLHARMCLLTVVLPAWNRTAYLRLERAQCLPSWQLVRNAVQQGVHQLQ